MQSKSEYKAYRADIDGLRAVLACETICLRRPRSSELDDQSSSELNSMMAEYWAQQELVSNAHARLDVLRIACLLAAKSAGRVDLIEKLQ